MKIVFYISICKSSYSFSANNVVILIYYGEFYYYVFKKTLRQKNNLSYQNKNLMREIFILL